MSKRDRWIARALVFAVSLSAALAFFVFILRWEITLGLVSGLSILLLPALLLAERWIERAYPEDLEEA